MLMTFIEMQISSWTWLCADMESSVRPVASTNCEEEISVPLLKNGQGIEASLPSENMGRR
jgi:hypothetical protein